MYQRAKHRKRIRRLRFGIETIFRGADVETHSAYRHRDATTEHREPCYGEKSDDIFVAVIESENAYDERYDRERDGKWIQYADLANVVAVTNRSSCSKKSEC